MYICIVIMLLLLELILIPFAGADFSSFFIMYSSGMGYFCTGILDSRSAGMTLKYDWDSLEAEFENLTVLFALFLGEYIYVEVVVVCFNIWVFILII